MAWQLTEDLETFRTTTGGFLRSRPAANTSMLKRLGHRPISDWTVLRFGPPGR